MANALYDAGREGFLAGDYGWATDDFRVILIDDTDYTKNLSTDDFLDDVAAGAREEVSGALGSKTETAGVADAADVTFSAASGDACDEILCYQHTGTDSTSALIFNIDTATGLPVTLSGGDVQVIWDSGANKIFKL